MKASGLKNREFNIPDGDWRDTQVVKGKAPKGHMGDDNNSTEQYTTKTAKVGSLGGNAASGQD